MARAGEVLEKARELYDNMGERTQKLAQAGDVAARDYQRLIEKIHEAASASDRFRNSSREAQKELKTTFSQLLWLILFVSVIGGLIGAGAVRFLFR